MNWALPKKTHSLIKSHRLIIAPSCLASLELHIQRANYVTAIWKRSLTAVTDNPEFYSNEWNISGEVEWIKNDPFPTEIEDLFLESGNFHEEVTEKVVMTMTMRMIFKHCFIYV